MGNGFSLVVNFLNSINFNRPVKIHSQYETLWSLKVHGL